MKWKKLDLTVIKNKLKRQQVLFELQLALTEAGGKLQPVHKLEKLTVKQLLNLIIPNNIEVTFNYKESHCELSDIDLSDIDFTLD